MPWLGQEPKGATSLLDLRRPWVDPRWVERLYSARFRGEQRSEIVIEDMSNTPTTVQRTEEQANEQAEQNERSYAEYSNKELAFDPLKDLNLPGSYDEVLSRFNRLQGDREPEVLN
jgi:hypothetical protein